MSADDVEGATGVVGRNGPEVITPKGGRLLKRMVEASLVPQRCASSPRDPSALDACIASEPDLLARTAERRAGRDACQR